ncbi:hypothetical protein LXL04_021920 [Taraxacum kok-saghyz]
MTSRSGDKRVDLWSQIAATESENELQQQQTAIVYLRKNPQKESLPTTLLLSRKQASSIHKNRASLAPGKRISWNRSLFTRGRTSIAVAVCTEYGPKKEKQIRKPKPPLSRAKGAPPQNFDKERAYFQEVDSIELIEESPSPQCKTWVMGNKNYVVQSHPHISPVLKKWLLSHKPYNYSCGPSISLSKILDTPSDSNSVHDGALNLQTTSESVSNKIMGNDDTSFTKRSDKIEKDSEEIEYAVRKLSLNEQQWDPLSALLAVCGQLSPSTFSDVLSQYCDLESIAKVGEGTYGEVFIAGGTVCKVVPFDGDSLVNGEVQKKAEELLEEVMLSLTLNQLRGHDNHIHNVCPTFIHTLGLRVCVGAYDDEMIRAWGEWDKKNNSENDHPSEFSEKQHFVVFVQEHGGQDLESFVLLNFNEAQSLLTQVCVALAVAEAAFEFEHRDLHWGNILLNRNGCKKLEFVIDGKKMQVSTHGLVASIIDFTLSRINTGEDILFLDLSLDPGLFEGPKGDEQSETYRKMKEATEDCWEGSFPKTNVLWLQYLVDVLLRKKVYDRTSRDTRELRSLKKRLNSYGSAKESILDPFFTELIVSD